MADLGTRTIRSSGGRSVPRTRKVRESSDINQLRDGFRNSAMGHVEATDKICFKSTVREDTIMLGIRQRLKNGDTRGETILREYEGCRCDIQRSRRLDICVFINTRRNQVPLRVFNGWTRKVLSHSWVIYLHRYFVFCRLGHLRDGRE